MTKDEIAAILAKPYAQQLLNGPEPARFAYDGLDGDPRVIPIGFWIEGERILMGTVPKSAKVAALRKNPKVALTVDTGAFPPKALLIRGTAEVELVQGVPEGYLAAGHKVMTDEQYPEWEAGVKGLYSEMVRITVTPTWAKLLDFETTIPKSVEDLIKEKSAG
ncbi:pyridoxamine 5'-phosphate oxidase family protein [Kribbella sp. CWNU-51]